MVGCDRPFKVLLREDVIMHPYVDLIFAYDNVYRPGTKYPVLYKSFVNVL